MKKVDFLKNDEEFLQLVARIHRNKSNAASKIRDDLYDFLRKHGLEVLLIEGAWRVVDIPKEKKIPLKPFKMTSNGRNPISDTKISEIKKMRLEGHSVRSIAKELKVGEGTVKKYMK